MAIKAASMQSHLLAIVFGAFLMCSAGAAKVPLAKDHIMLQAGYETSKANVVKKAPVMDDDEEDDEPGPQDSCAAFGNGDGSCGKLSGKVLHGSPQILSQPPPATTATKAAESKAAPISTPPQETKGTSRLQKATTMKKVVILDEDDE